MESPECVLLGSEIDRQIRELSHKSQSEFDELCIYVIDFFIDEIDDQFERSKFISRLPDKFMKRYQLIYKHRLKGYLCNYICGMLAERRIFRNAFLSKFEDSDKKHLIELILDSSSDSTDYDNMPLKEFINILKMIGAPIEILSQFPEAFNAFDVIDRMQVVDYLKKMRP